jgi:hypothetical protein
MVKLFARARAFNNSKPKYTQFAPFRTAASSCGHPPAGASTSGFFLARCLLFLCASSVSSFARLSSPTPPALLREYKSGFFRFCASSSSSSLFFFAFVLFFFFSFSSFFFVRRDVKGALGAFRREEERAFEARKRDDDDDDDDGIIIIIIANRNVVLFHLRLRFFCAAFSPNF